MRWYDRHQRDLPWRRRAGDPYAQWVAEVMLQQTRVPTVIEYYEPFLRRFPTIQALARARHQEVLKHWEGLGYYRRALYLHRAAQVVCSKGGQIPTTASELRALPGVGEYTAAAIASIAFNRAEAAVDGNVARVLSRLFGVTDDIGSSIGKHRIRDLAAALLPAKRPGDFNQAWMDLGSMVCTPRSPQCPRCLLASVCVAAKAGCTDVWPVRDERHRRTVGELTFAVGIFVRAGAMMVRRRPIGGLWSGLWEFPTVEVGERSQAVRHARGIAKREGLTIMGRFRRIDVLRHQLTHRTLRFHAYVGQVRLDASTPKANGSTRWVTMNAFSRLPVSTAHRRVLDAAKNAVARFMP
jgi:A/G-specific adenine glycosylase